MENPNEADESIHRVENQVVDWMVDEDTRVSINQMIEAVNESIEMRHDASIHNYQREVI